MPGASCLRLECGRFQHLKADRNSPLVVSMEIATAGVFRPIDLCDMFHLFTYRTNQYQQETGE
ncbi:hypothetical protein Q669_10465 [Labrenzia sp. C1B10]|nr:hypothetical protein Q669_10465 [Labrenzia sp. C1B10]ERP99181.1 hypothetical protein Q675_11445 [Labrenzia sp. C1B70]